MNNLDVAGILQTYSMKCSKARNKKHLQELINRLKAEFNYAEIAKFTMEGDDSNE